MTCGVCCNNCCKHVHFKLLFTILIFFIFYHWYKVYNKIFSALSIHKCISITRQCTQEDGIPKMNCETWTHSSLSMAWCMPIQHQNNCVVYREMCAKGDMKSWSASLRNKSYIRMVHWRNEQSCNGSGSFEAKFKQAVTGKIGNVSLIVKISEFTSSQLHMLNMPQNVELSRNFRVNFRKLLWQKVQISKIGSMKYLNWKTECKVHIDTREHSPKCGSIWKL